MSRFPRADGARLLLVDSHEVSRAACRALLRTEGIEVVADVRVGEEAVAAARELLPMVAIVDVCPQDDDALSLARRLRNLKPPLTVILTSSAPYGRFDGELDEFPFIAKGDLCTAEVLRAMTR